MLNHGSIDRGGAITSDSGGNEEKQLPWYYAICTDNKPVHQQPSRFNQRDEARDEERCNTYYQPFSPGKYSIQVLDGNSCEQTSSTDIFNAYEIFINDITQKDLILI